MGGSPEIEKWMALTPTLTYIAEPSVRSALACNLYYSPCSCTLVPRGPCSGSMCRTLSLISRPPTSLTGSRSARCADRHPCHNGALFSIEVSLMSKSGSEHRYLRVLQVEFVLIGETEERQCTRCGGDADWHPCHNSKNDDDIRFLFTTTTKQKELASRA